MKTRTKCLLFALGVWIGHLQFFEPMWGKGGENQWGSTWITAYGWPVRYVFQSSYHWPPVNADIRDWTLRGLGFDIGLFAAILFFSAVRLERWMTTKHEIRVTSFLLMTLVATVLFAHLRAAVFERYPSSTFSLECHRLLGCEYMPGYDSFWYREIGERCFEPPMAIGFLLSICGIWYSGAWLARRFQTTDHDDRDKPR